MSDSDSDHDLSFFDDIDVSFRTQIHDSNSSVKFKDETFKGASNWTSWKFWISAKLKLANVSDIIEISPKQALSILKSYGLSSVPFKKAIRALQEKYLFTYSAIIGEIGMKFNHLISYIPTGRVDLVWKELHNEFDRNDASTIRALKFEFERLEMNSN